MNANEPFDARTSSTKPSSSRIFESARKIRLEKQRLKKERTRDKLAEFMNADVHDSEFGIIPEGYGGITYFTFFIFAPWIAGTLFMFLYVSGGSVETFTALESNIMFTWVIGYEILAAIILLVIFKKLIVYLLR